MKRWFLIIEGALCGIYLNKEEGENEYNKAKNDFPYADELVELAEVISTTANDKTINVKKTTKYREMLSRMKALIKDERSGINLNREKRDKE